MNHTKTKTCLFFTIFILINSILIAQNYEVVYLEGGPRLRDGNGELSFIDYDSRLTTGDSVVTGRMDLAEIAQGTQMSIRVKPNTVFTIRELDTSGEKEQVLTTTLGAVSMRFNRLTGKEPRVGSVGTTAGIRGTELTVYAGPDGSTLFIVETGLVSVETQGTTIDLSMNEGIEISAAGVPGEKFSVIGRELDFSSWAMEKAQALLDDPVSTLADLRIMFGELKKGLDEWTVKYNAAKAESDVAVEKLRILTDKAEQEKYRDEVWFPLALRTGTAVLNYRYYALSAFSLRRYVLGPLYVQMRSRNMVTSSSVYESFREAYTKLLDEYTLVFGPYLNVADY